MGNWHCVPSSCATVNYREYQGGKVRWRYGTEPWQEIIGADDYSTYSSYNLSANTSYKYVYRSAIVTNGLFQGWGNESRGVLGSINGIQDWYVTFDKTLRANNVTTVVRKVGFPPNDTFDYYSGDTFPPAGYRSIVPTIYVLSQGSWRSFSLPSTFGIWITGIEPSNLNGATTQCKFKVFKKGVEVYSETRATCPQVEVIPCSLSPQSKAIKIKKYRYLDRIEVVPYSYDVRWGYGVDSSNYGLLLAKGKIPPECLNIYKNDVTSTIPNNFGQFNNTPESGFNLINQICSAPGCPPPKYDVACDDCCERCPDGTCPVECDGQICCYNDYGVSVQTIAKTNFCGGAL